MTPFQEWKNHPITKEILSDVSSLISEVQERSCIRDTVDQTAMQVCRNEGICEGVSAFIDSIENMTLNSKELDNED